MSRLVTTHGTEAHDAVAAALIDFLKEHCDERGMTKAEVLAIASHVVGRIACVQDGITTAECLEIINRNVLAGNKSMYAALVKDAGGIQ